MIKVSYLNNGIEMMKSGNYDSVFTGYKREWDAVWDEHGNPVGWDIYNRPRRQDVPEQWIEDGMFYMTKRENLLKSKLRYSGKMGIVKINQKDSFEIDTFQDLELIRGLMK
jgi:CMP-N-acetylneuraminic acid synthetase